MTYGVHYIPQIIVLVDKNDVNRLTKLQILLTKSRSL